jgi:hypothetical protein
MKYNLIFGGIEQTALDYEEETEAVLKVFIKTELEIPDADQINFQNVHRLRKRNDGKPRNIIARFTHYKDHERYDCLMCCPSYAWRLLDLDAQHGFHRTDDHLQKSGHIPMMRAYHVSGAKFKITKSRF